VIKPENTEFKREVYCSPSQNMGMHTIVSIKQGMGSHAGAWEPERIATL